VKQKLGDVKIIVSSISGPRIIKIDFTSETEVR